MKKYILYFLTVISAVSFFPENLNAATSPVTTVVDPAQSQIVLASRLHEIQSMDQSAMTTAEKKELRQEERNINATLRDGSGGVYISVGALLIIIVILIILI